MGNTANGYVPQRGKQRNGVSSHASRQSIDGEGIPFVEAAVYCVCVCVCLPLPAAFQTLSSAAVSISSSSLGVWRGKRLINSIDKGNPPFALHPCEQHPPCQSGWRDTSDLVNMVKRGGDRGAPGDRRDMIKRGMWMKTHRGEGQMGPKPPRSCTVH